MKYIVTKFENCEEALSSYCQRNAEALVVKDEKFTKLYIKPKVILNLRKYKSFCKYLLPYIRSKKSVLSFYRANVEFPILEYAEALFGVKAESLTLQTQLKLEGSVQVNKYCYFYSGKQKGGE